MKNKLTTLILILSFALSVMLTGCDLIVGGTGITGGIGGSSCECADSDNNGKCDECGESVLVELDFYVINDMHGKLTDGSGQPGADELSSYLLGARSTDDNAIFLSSGDMWQGGSESNLTGGLIMTDWMNAIGFSAMTLGNHEFDWGEDGITPNKEAADFPFLAINVYRRSTNTRAEFATPSVLIEKSGIKIGIIGAVGDCYSSISQEEVEDLTFKVDDELTELVKAESERLRSDGADIIIYSLHDGFGTSKSTEEEIADSRLMSYYSPELSKGGYVDIVFEGHTHRSYVLRDEHGVYHMQAGGENKALAHAEIYVNFANGTHLVTEREIISGDEYSKYPKNALIDTLLEKYKDKVSVGQQILGKNKKTRYSEELEQLVADLYLKAGQEKWGGKYTVTLGGGFIKARSPYNLPSGEVRYGSLQEIFPFDNEIVLCSIRGYDLKKRFIDTTNTDYFISSSSDITTLRDSIVDNETYYVVVDSYTSQYAPNKLTVVETYDTTTFARDLLAEFIKSGGLN